MMDRKTITIVGSRDVDRQAARSLFEQHLSPYLHQRHVWMLGSARGIDQWAVEWLLEQSETAWLVIPYTMARQPQWVHEWFAEVERVVELQLPRRKTASGFRNQYMVGLSQVVFGFWSGKGGGTIKTLKHAMRKGREVHGIPVAGVDVRQDLQDSQIEQWAK